jgi:hypothetical protein
VEADWRSIFQVKPSVYFPIMDNGMHLARVEYTLSMLSLVCSTVLHGRKFLFTGQSYAYPDGNRNIATATFLKSDYDEMVLIDTDVVFEPIHMEWLLSHDAALIGGIVPKKKPVLEYSIDPLPTNPDPFRKNEDLCEVAYVCGAFMRIKREVFETLKSHPDVREYECMATHTPQLEFWHNTIGGHSDDAEFCHRYRHMGGHVYVDKRITLRHAGSAIYPIATRNA